MKSYDYEAVVYDGAEYCVECLPVGVSVDSEDVSPIFADMELDFAPVCANCGVEHDYMNLPPKPKFFTFEMHESDGNDNWISEFFVRAPNQDAAWIVVETLVRVKLDGKITHDDSDTDKWVIFYDRDNNCPNGEDCDDERCSNDHRTHSLTFYAHDELEKEPEGPSAFYHSWGGEWEVE